MFEQVFHEAFQAAVALGGPAPTANCGAAPAAGSRWLNAHLAWCVARCTSRSARTESNPLLFFVYKLIPPPQIFLAGFWRLSAAHLQHPLGPLTKHFARTLQQHSRSNSNSSKGLSLGTVLESTHSADTHLMR
jgi:hypothetical protein